MSGPVIEIPSEHKPVLLHETIALLAPAPGKILCDGTVGAGGHAARWLEATSPNGKVLGLDKDPEMLPRAQERLSPFSSRFQLVNGAYSQMDKSFKAWGYEKVDGILLDIGGISSFHLEEPERGFSFRHEGPLDMRIDRTKGETAAELLAQISESDLADIIFQFGEDRLSRRIARQVVIARQQGAMATTGDLVKAIFKAQPSKKRRQGIHPATRTFMALRIAINRELEELKFILSKFHQWLNPGGRMAVISFHSLEDRLTKHAFKNLARSEDAPIRLLTRKPIIPGSDEMNENPRSRSAKLRVVEKLA